MSLILKLFLTLTATVALFSCTRASLTVLTDYLSHENLASYYVRTPDPNLNCPPVGQRLMIFWVLPSHLMLRDDIYLDMRIHLRNREEICKTFPISGKRHGCYIYGLYNTDYAETGGILTYQIRLLAGDCVFKEWRHLLWAELIKFETPPKISKKELEEFDLPPDDEEEVDFDLESVDD